MIMEQFNLNTLEPGTILWTSEHTSYRIIKQLSEGGQGWTYLVEGPYGCKCLKTYKPDFLSFRPDMMNLLRAKLPKPPKSAAYVWPQEVIDCNLAKGYVMDFVDDTYKLMSRFLRSTQSGGVRFKNLKTTIDAMLGLASAFNVLHQTGYNYQDLSCGNFMIDPDTGDVRIIDNDNVSVEKTASGVLGTPGFIAPEVLARRSIPSIYSDRFSLSVIMFLLLFHGHPLEGRRFLTPLFAEEQAMALYCTDPVFVFDPKDRRNALVSTLPQHRLMMGFWHWLPDYVRELFLRAFSRETMLEKPSLRPTENEWEQVLSRLRSSLITCPYCDQESLFTGDPNMVCEDCKRPMGKLTLLRTKHCKYPVPVGYGGAVMSSQLRFCNIGEGTVKDFIIRRKQDDHTCLYLTNQSDKPVMVLTKGGKNVPLAPGKSVAVTAVRQIRMVGGEIITAE